MIKNKSWIIALCIFPFALSCSVMKTRTSLHSATKKTSFIISSDIDLKGETLYLPQGDTLIFDGGSLSNGHIIFNDTPIEGHPTFRNCTYEGTIRTDAISDKEFTSRDDEGTLVFLLYNAILNGIKCDFYRDYRINMNDASPGTGIVFCQEIDSGAEISFHGHTIFNITPFQTPRIKPVIVFRNVKHVTIHDCCFHDIDNHNTHKFSESFGCTFIQCLGDCEGINLIDCRQENGDCILRSGVYVHDKLHPENTPRRGLTNSILKVESLNTGYGLALYCGDNLKIEINAICPHRGLYCAGVSNSIIQYKGYNPLETKCHILLKDAVYRKIDNRNTETLDMKGCHDLVINAILDELLPNECVIYLHTYGIGNKGNADFSFRTEKCHHYSIDFSTTINRAPDEGFYIICGCAPEGDLNEGQIMYGCKVSNVTLHDIQVKNSSSNKYLCNIGSYIDATIKTMNCRIKDSKNPKEGFNIQIRGNSTGSISATNCNLGSVLVRGKNKGRFEVVVKGDSVIQGIHYTNDHSSKELVRIKQERPSL